MNDTRNINSLVAQINTSTKALDDSDAQEREKARVEALAAVRKLERTLATPEEVILHHAFEIPPLNMCLRLGISLRLFHIIAEQEAHATTSTELANISHGEKLFIVRIMRVLVAAGYAAEPEAECYSSTSLTTAMTAPAIEANIIHRYDFGLPIFAKAPEFFESNGFKSPSEYKDTPFQLAFQTKLGFYEYLAQRPKASKNFHTYMKSYQLGTPQWVDWFPVKEQILDEFRRNDSGGGKDDNVLLVDVGGGHGHYIKLFHQKFPHAPGHLILQDLPGTLAGIDQLGEGIEAMAHDFFTPQPIQGARVYYFHFVFVDWSDAKCLEILRHIVHAMTPGYSKLILNDLILPDKDCPWPDAALDIIMMGSFSGRHRSQSQFANLLESAGLEVLKFWYPPRTGDGVVEAMRKV